MIGLYFGALAALYLSLRLWYINRNTPSGKWFMTISSVVFTLILFEFTANITFYVMTGKWVFAELESHNSKLWEEHPQLIGVNKKNVSVYLDGHTYSHNSKGWRGAEKDNKDGEIVVAAIGGSTTYGVGVSDNETWPHYLDSLLPEGYKVINMGVPGYSTIDNTKQVGLYLEGINPGLVLLHVGLNDLRISHLENIEDSYADFQAAGLFASLGLCYRYKLPKIASLRAIIIVLQELGWYPTCLFHQFQFNGYMQSGVDSIALDIYENHLKDLVGQLADNGAEVFLVPQVINLEQYQKFPYQWWIPYIEPSSIDKHIEAFNNTSENVFGEVGLGVYINSVDSVKWKVTDFCDAVHLNRDGNLKLASIVSRTITEARGSE